jgi:hypothetical protein
LPEIEASRVATSGLLSADEPKQRNRVVVYYFSQWPGTSDKTKGDACASPLVFDVKASYFFLAFFFAFFLVAMFLFSLSIFHGCAVLSEKPQLMNV